MKAKKVKRTVNLILPNGHSYELPGVGMSSMAMRRDFRAGHWSKHIKFECGEPGYSSMPVGIYRIYRGGQI